MEIVNLNLRFNFERGNLHMYFSYRRKSARVVSLNGDRWIASLPIQRGKEEGCKDLSYCPVDVMELNRIFWITNCDPREYLVFKRTGYISPALFRAVNEYEERVRARLELAFFRRKKGGYVKIYGSSSSIVS